MNLRGESELLRTKNIVPLIAVLLFFVGALYWVSSYRDHAAFWEDFYAKEIARQINLADSGTVLELDVTKALSIAEKNRKNPQSLFSIDNDANRVIVSLREGGGRSYRFFNDVEVINENVQLLSGGGTSPINHLRLRIL